MNKRIGFFGASLLLMAGLAQSADVLKVDAVKEEVPLKLAPIVTLPPIPAFDQKLSSFAQNPIVYFVITDRFVNGNPSNDHSYGRKGDGKQEIGTFHGGDLAGITLKLKEGYFKDLGVNALWITAPYEQIHGWIVGGKKEFQHYGYHGYFALDYTVLDKNMGTPAELKEMIDTAHAQGIRVLFDVVMNHPGYGDLWTLNQYKVNVATPDLEDVTLINYHKTVDYRSEEWAKWWGPDWIRAGLGGAYEEGSPTDDLTMQLSYLPDFKTESTKPVKLPWFLKNKPDTKARDIPNFRVNQYLVKWLTDWVREYGVDGFRCDTAKHVDLESWALLKSEGTKALQQWKLKNPTKKIDNAPFWMVGEVFPHGVVKDQYFTKGGFDSVLNFDFQAQADDVTKLDAVYSSMATTLSSQQFDVLSYISSHDTRLFNRKNLYNGGAALMLAPGGVQIYYGDESSRPTGPFSRSDRQQATRSDMNWTSLDASMQAHWQILTQFRLRHPAVARGKHQILAGSPYVFSRTLDSDRVVVGLAVDKASPIPVASAFANGSKVRDAYTGAIYAVKNNQVLVNPGVTGVVLLEPVL